MELTGLCHCDSIPTIRNDPLTQAGSGGKQSQIAQSRGQVFDF